MSCNCGAIPIVAGFMLAVLQAIFAPLNAMGQDSSTSEGPHKLEFLPILSYDTDAGFGYGLKTFFLSYFHRDESVDVTLFNSSKGERWYKLVFSMPDFELREGKIYPVAVDLTIDYDKWIAYDFFGLGNTSAYDSKETYTREALNVSLDISRAITAKLIGRAGLRYSTTANFNFQLLSSLERLEPPLNAGRARFVSLQTALRYDSRNSFVNPSGGLVVQGEYEYVPPWKLSNVDFSRYGLWFQAYSLTPLLGTIFALRSGLQVLDGQNLPVQVLLPIGGGGTLRGDPQDRFLDKISAVINVEMRFPLFWRFGGILGCDAGKVWSELGQLDLREWVVDPVAGLRFYFDTFIVRLDAGVGSETTGVYLNFGQLF